MNQAYSPGASSKGWVNSSYRLGLPDTKSAPTIGLSFRLRSPSPTFGAFTAPA